MDTQKIYDELVALGKKIAILQSIGYFLEWDEETYMTPGSTEMRSEQKALIASQAHATLTSNEFSTKLEKLIDLNSGEYKARDLSDLQKAALREWKQDFYIAKCLPSSLVEEESALSSKACEAWKAAKSNNNFGTFAPFLEQVVELNMKKADCMGFNDHPYDAMLMVFEPHMTVKELDAIFGNLQPELTTITKEICAKDSPDISFLTGDYPGEKTTTIGRELMQEMGLDHKFARLDLAIHPFCMTGHPENIRLTTHQYDDNFFKSISTIMHEAGHGLYEHGFDKALFGTPLCDSISFGFHESQSKFWENQIGRSKPFCTHILPKLQKTFPSLESVSPDALYAAINHVHPSLIRIYADEVTYCLHIIIRYEIESSLLDGTLKVKDVPAIWNEKMQKYLGVTPDTDADGCLQDIHWACCHIGYFPSYALGVLYSSQFTHAMTADIPDWETQLAQGNMHNIATWLKENIHRHGRRYTASELIQNLTGEPLSAKYFTNYLRDKFSL